MNATEVTRKKKKKKIKKKINKKNKGEQLEAKGKLKSRREKKNFLHGSVSD